MGENNIGKGLTKQDLDLKGWINFLNVWTIKAEPFFFVIRISVTRQFLWERIAMKLKFRKYKVTMMQTILCSIYRLVSRDFYYIMKRWSYYKWNFYHWCFVEFEIIMCHNLLIFIL